MHNSTDKTDREKLSGFFRFAQGVLAARDKAILRMGETGLGCFLENEIINLPGLTLNTDEDRWLVLQRLRESQPPFPEPLLAEWLDESVDDPAKPPRFKPVIVREVDIEEASDLCEAGLIDLEDIFSRSEEASLRLGAGESSDTVKVALRLERLTEVQAALEAWRDDVWETWALDERPVRKSIQLYNE